jgi:hypothetical protein
MPVKLQAEIYILNMLTNFSRATLTEVHSGMIMKPSGQDKLGKLDSFRSVTKNDEQVDRYRTEAPDTQESDGSSDYHRNL